MGRREVQLHPSAEAGDEVEHVVADSAVVARAFSRGGILLAEAGTGTGKTLAYLAPAILSGHRVVVSTGTKNLQEQIYFKDLPVLRDALGVPFTATYMKGRGNYLCLHRFASMRDDLEAGSPADRRGPGYFALLEKRFSAVRAGDILLHHPFDSFGPVLEFLETAAVDKSWPVDISPPDETEIEALVVATLRRIHQSLQRR